MDLLLGRDGPTTDETLTEYLLRRDARGSRLIARCWGRESEVDPAEAAAELDRRAAVSREMAGICGAVPSDYPARARAASAAAAAIRSTFELDDRGGPPGSAR